MNSGETKPPLIALALGSNLGDRREALEQACAALERHGVHILHRSHIYHTRPWGVSGQPEFLNAVVLAATSQQPQELLETCLAVERELGRERFVKWGPRRIDIDLLFYDAARLNTETLVLPHPWLAQRDFVLAPLLDLTPAPPEGSGLPDFSEALGLIPESERSVITSEPW